LLSEFLSWTMPANSNAGCPLIATRVRTVASTPGYGNVQPEPIWRSARSFDFQSSLQPYKAMTKMNQLVTGHKGCQWRPARHKGHPEGQQSPWLSSAMWGCGRGKIPLPLHAGSKAGMERRAIRAANRSSCCIVPFVTAKRLTAK